MSFVLLISMALLAFSLIGSLVVLYRSGETRVGLLAAISTMMLVRQSVTLWAQRDAPTELGLDLSTAGELMGLGASLLLGVVLIAIHRTLGERDRIESLHWDAMEAVRGLCELTAKLDGVAEPAAAGASTGLANRIAGELEGPMNALLDIGRRCFGLPVGIMSRIRDEHYEVKGVLAPRGFPLRTGAVLDLAATPCAGTVGARRPVALAVEPASGAGSRPNGAAYEFAAYLGAPILVNGNPYGTLCFCDPAPRRRSFTGTDKDVLTLMAQWLGNRIEQIEMTRVEAAPTAAAPALTANEPASPTVAATDPQATGWRRSGNSAPNDVTPARAWRGPSAPTPADRPQNPRPLGVDVNREMKSLEPRLQSLVGDSIDLQFSLDPGLQRADMGRVPLREVVLSLADHSARAMPSGGTLRLETANLEIVAGEPGVMNAVVPDRYVTLRMSSSATDLDVDTLSGAFDAIFDEGSNPVAMSERLSLPVVYRVLQGAGGDLSVEVEAGRGATFTIFLPRPRSDLDSSRSTSEAPGPSAIPTPPA